MRLIIDRDDVRKCVEAYAETLMPGFSASMTNSYNITDDLECEMAVPEPDGPADQRPQAPMPTPESVL